VRGQAPAPGWEVEVTTVTEALTRLKIVREAVDGIEPNELAVTEAHAAVEGFLEAILEDNSDEAGTERAQLAMQAKALELTMPALGELAGPDHPVARTTFAIYANAVELLVKCYEEGSEPDSWLELGISNGWVSPPWCAIHAGPPMTEDEEAELEAHDGDPDCLCLFSVRLLP
jgi:PHP family Zn ribbon phosphoesterase